MRYPQRRTFIKLVGVLILMVLTLELWQGIFLHVKLPFLFRRLYFSVPLFEDVVNDTFPPHLVTLTLDHRVTVFDANPPRSSLRSTVRDLASVLDRHPHLNLIDVGAQTALFTLTAAAKMRRVVALPVDMSGARRLRKAAVVNGLRDRIKIVRRPLSGIETALSVGNLQDAVVTVGGTIVALNGGKALRRLRVPLVIVDCPSLSLSGRRELFGILSSMRFQAHSSLIAESKLASLECSDLVVWKSPFFPIAADRLLKKEKGVTKLTILPNDSGRNASFPFGYLPVYSGRSIKVFVYEKQDYISRWILSGSQWERDIVQPLLRFLETDRDLQFIDVGANLGVYSLSVAAIGRLVVAVDANRNNLVRIAKSAEANGFQERITLVYNAIDSTYKTLYLKLVPDNIGGSPTVDNGHDETKVQAILADDILEVIAFKRAVLKIDIEGKEGAVLRGIRKLFQKVDVPLVIFEWARKQHNQKEDAKFIRDFFITQGYLPYRTIESTNPLPYHFTNWPWDMVWKRDRRLRKMEIKG